MKRFLTQCLLEQKDIVKAKIRHQGDWHRLVWQAFRPIEGDGGPRKFLYAVEAVSGGYKTLILSDEVPTRPDWCSAHGWTSKMLPEGLLAHSRYVFSLIANPTSTRDGKRTSVAQRRGPEDDIDGRLIQWLKSKGRQGGFAIDDSRLVLQPLGVEKFPNHAGQVTLQYIRYQGVLEVTNQPNFQTAFNTGIGRAKSYGAGLLLLKPIK